METEHIIRVKQKALDADWENDLKALGITVPEERSDLRYTPIIQSLLPYTLEIDLKHRVLTRRIIGVLPNEMYASAHHIYLWDEFCRILEEMYQP